MVNSFLAEIRINYDVNNPTTKKENKDRKEEERDTDTKPFNGENEGC